MANWGSAVRNRTSHSLTLLAARSDPPAALGTWSSWIFPFSLFSSRKEDCGLFHHNPHRWRKRGHFQDQGRTWAQKSPHNRTITLIRFAWEGWGWFLNVHHAAARAVLASGILVYPVLQGMKKTRYIWGICELGRSTSVLYLYQIDGSEITRRTQTAPSALFPSTNLYQTNWPGKQIGTEKIYSVLANYISSLRVFKRLWLEMFVHTLHGVFNGWQFITRPPEA